MSQCSSSIFQSALPRRERQKVRLQLIFCNHFNPRSREGSDSGQTLRILLYTPSFQSALPRRERRPAAHFQHIIFKFQSALPRRERRPAAHFQHIIFKFQSALPRRERLFAWPSRCDTYNFNPRSREGSDPQHLCVCPRFSDFNPRSREGSDLTVCPMQQFLLQFQSALPRRERQDRFGLVEIEGAFQSALPRRERHQELWTLSLFRQISIRAPAKGATVRHPGGATACKISIRAPAKGATCRIRPHRLSRCNFNPRSREGSDLCGKWWQAFHPYFNPRSREGSDICLVKFFLFITKFQSALPRRERLLIVSFLFP